MKYSEIIQKVSKDTGIAPNIINKAYRAYWKYIRYSISNLPLKEVQSEESFYKLRTNFNIPSLGKLSCTYDRYIGVRKRFKYFNKDEEVN